jgi:hypothetical protein
VAGAVAASPSLSPRSGPFRLMNHHFAICSNDIMADQAQARMLSAAFPTPPPYYKHFTKPNVTKVRQIRKEAATNTNQVDVESLPAELRYLIPPEPPVDGRYKSFGAQHDVRVYFVNGQSKKLILYRSWRNQHNHWRKQESKNCIPQMSSTSIPLLIYRP